MRKAPRDDAEPSARGPTPPRHTAAPESAVLGAEPELFFYSKRRSATGYIYVYALMERQSYAGMMQRDMIRQIEAASPKYVGLR